jgi:ribosome-associated heat shock protein Hsp15
MDDVRIDKWWAARFFKTRSLAQHAIDNGRVLVGGERVKLSRAVREGDEIEIRIGEMRKTVVVRDVSDQRRAAPIAQALYEETAESVRARVDEIARRALYREPAAQVPGRPTKRDRRDLDRWRGGEAPDDTSSG